MLRSSRAENKEINYPAFDRMLAAFHPERHSASLRYEEIRLFLIRYFRINGSLSPEDNADKVFDRVLCGIAEKKLTIDENNPYPLFYKTAGFVLLESRRKNQVRFLSLEDMPPSNEPSYDPRKHLEELYDKLKKEAGFEALNECRNCLDEKERDLLTRYEGAAGKDKAIIRAQISDELGKTTNALKIKINRIRKKLIECVRKKLKLN